MNHKDTANTRPKAAKMCQTKVAGNCDTSWELTTKTGIMSRLLRCEALRAFSFRAVGPIVAFGCVVSTAIMGFSPHENPTPPTKTRANRNIGSTIVPRAVNAPCHATRTDSANANSCKKRIFGFSHRGRAASHSDAQWKVALPIHRRATMVL